MQKVGIKLEKLGICSIFENYINKHDLMEVKYKKTYVKWERLDNNFYYDIIFDVMHPKNSTFHRYVEILFDEKQDSMNIYNYRYSYLFNVIHIYIRKNDALKMERNIKLNEIIK